MMSYFRGGVGSKMTPQNLTSFVYVPYATFNALKILLSIGIFLEREDTLAAETKSPMQTFAVSDISSLSFLFLLAEHTYTKSTEYSIISFSKRNEVFNMKLRITRSILVPT